ncbi:MAG: tyrosinase [Alphaproteobacteria bacterium]|nr:tyrosinase [Alphaproteobacteria bacterium]
MATGTLGVRRSISDIQRDYDNGNKAPLENLMRAWKGIKDLPPSDPNSFFVIGGFHGEPFRGPGETDLAWWGGYCQHGTVLFPSWHRAYLWRLERALQSIPGCQDVMQPFWDECSDESREKGIPRALTDETFELDGHAIPNPLKSFLLPEGFVDKLPVDPNLNPTLYSKPKGYETVRYPLSGLVGTPDDQKATASHNAQFSDAKKNVQLLNDNISTWLSGKIKVDGRWLGEVYHAFVTSLDAPTYTLFSNTTSQRAWNKAHRTSLVSLEAPHNYIHLAVGGFDYPGAGSVSAIPGANGDMGENDTAGLDPIFFFHHCFIDYAFWIWQRRHGATDSFTIDAGDPGTKFTADVPPPTTMQPTDTLAMESPLDPFDKRDGSGRLTTNDCVNIEAQMGYTYGPGSLDGFATSAAEKLMASRGAIEPGRTLRVTRINRGKIRGSFLITAFAKGDSKREYIGTEAILSRWHVEGCMNCQNHLEATAQFRMPTLADATLMPAEAVEVEVRTRDGLLGGRAVSPRTAAKLMVTAERSDAPFLVELL